MHISFEESKHMRYRDLYTLVRRHGEITMEASVINYNPAFGLVYLDIHPDDRDKVFGDDDESNTNFHNFIYRGLTNLGTTKITKENNRFIFTISDKGDFGPNTHGLGINSVKKPSTSIMKSNSDVKSVFIFFLIVLFITLLILI